MKIWRLALINLITLLIILIGLELLFTFLFYIKDVKRPLVFSSITRDAPYVYYSFKPKKRGTEILVNEDGLATSYPRHKRPGSYRIAILGGSVVRGTETTAYAGGITKNLEALLRRNFQDKDIELINAGMHGYVAEQDLIFYQLALSKYQPDLVISLLGYNDIMGVKLNRQEGLFIAPQNMKQFNVIEEGRKKRTFLGRLSYLFPNTFRAMDFLRRWTYGKSSYDYSRFDTKIVEAAKEDFIGVVKDTHALCKAKGAEYLVFLQPIKWYGDYRRGLARPQDILALGRLYSAYEKGIEELPYGFSLTDIFEERPSVFIDDAHINTEGFRMMAEAIYREVKEIIERG